MADYEKDYQKEIDAKNVLLSQCLRKEDYLECAKLRDRINELKIRIELMKNLNVLNEIEMKASELVKISYSIDKIYEEAKVANNFNKRWIEIPGDFYISEDGLKELENNGFWVDYKNETYFIGW